MKFRFNTWQYVLQTSLNTLQITSPQVKSVINPFGFEILNNEKIFSPKRFYIYLAGGDNNNNISNEEESFAEILKFNLRELFPEFHDSLSIIRTTYNKYVFEDIINKPVKHKYINIQSVKTDDILSLYADYVLVAFFNISSRELGEYKKLNKLTINRIYQLHIIHSILFQKYFSIRVDLKLRDKLITHSAGDVYSLFIIKNRNIDKNDIQLLQQVHKENAKFLTFIKNLKNDVSLCVIELTMGDTYIHGKINKDFYEFSRTEIINSYQHFNTF